MLNGSRAWGPNTGAGTKKGRIDPLDVVGRYELHWSDYSRLPGGGRGAELRHLVIEIGTQS